MKDYRTFYEKQTAFLRKLKNPALLLKILDKCITILIANICLVGNILALFGLFDTHLPAIFTFAITMAATLLAVELFRAIFPRKRPYSPDGAGIHPICKKKKESNSFPSRHVASAFVIGVSFCSASLWLGIPVLVLGAMLAYVRFLCGYHYPSDLFGGAVLGSLLGVLSFFL